MKTLQFITSVLVTVAMFIILVYEDKNQIIIRWLAAGVGFAALALQVLLYFTRNTKTSAEKSDISENEGV